MRTIASHWQRFEQMVLTGEHTELDRTEARVAFYAGFESAMVAYAEVCNAGLSDVAVTAVLNGFHEEADGFAATLGSVPA
jgi:hypothetical protein